MNSPWKTATARQATILEKVTGHGNHSPLPTPTPIKKQQQQRNQWWENGAFWTAGGFILDSLGGWEVCCSILICPRLQSWTKLTITRRQKRYVSWFAIFEGNSLQETNKILWLCRKKKNNYKKPKTLIDIVREFNSALMVNIVLYCCLGCGAQRKCQTIRDSHSRLNGC